MKKKYIIFDECFPIIFSECHTHSEIAQGVSNQPTSAGFFDTWIENNKIRIQTYGDSLSLKIKSNQNDARIIEKLLN